MKYLFFVFFLFLISCDGTLGGFNERAFLVKKESIEKAIDTLFLNNPEFVIPEKWKGYDNWESRGFGFLDSRIFYLQSNPEEMYYVSFVENGNGNQDEVGPTLLAIRSVGSSNGNWTEYENFTEKERERIEQRFDKEIISKIEKYSGFEAVR